MISLVLKSLLALSLAANASLVFALWGPGDVQKPAAEVPAAAATIVSRSVPAEADGSSAPPSRPPLASPADRTLILEVAARYGRTPAPGDPRAVAERMFRDGYPDDVVASVLGELIDEWLGQKELDKAAREGDATARRLRKIGAGDGPLQKYMQDLLPQWREERERTKAHERQLRFGAMPLEKILEVERLEQEFFPAGRDSRQFANFQPSVENEAKLHEALGRVLTPAELKDYIRFNSTVARNLQRQISSIQIDEATYDRLLAVATAREGEPRRFAPLGDYHGILTDEQFVQLIPRAGGFTDGADGIYQAAGLTDAQRARFFVQVETLGRERNQEAAKAALAHIRAALALSPENTASFERTAVATLLKEAAENR